MGVESLVNLEIENKPTRRISPLRKVLPQIIAVSVKNVLVFSFGMTVGFITILISRLSERKNGETIILDKEAISWIGSINLLGVSLGGLLSGFIVQPLGRKRAMQLINVPFFASWLLLHYASEPWHVFLALYIIGFGGGAREAATVPYLAEVTTPNLRGILYSITGVAALSGISIQFILGTFFPWRTVALISSIVPVITFVLLFFVPESPYWLVSKNLLEEAQKSIAWLRGWLDVTEVEEEFKEFYKLFKSQSPTETANTRPSTRLSALRNYINLYLQKSFLWPFSLITLTFLTGHFGGMTTVQTYAVPIFGSLGAPIDKYYATVILGVAQVVGCISSLTLVHFTGKRNLTFFSLVGTALCFFVVATYAQLIGVRDMIVQVDQNGTAAADGFRWIPMIFLIGAAFFSSTAIRILPWMLIGEAYHNEIRSTASGFSGAVGHILGFCANKTFLSLVSLITLPGSFWMYSGISVLGFLLFYFLLPETEGKTLFQISEHFGGGSKLDNTVTNFVSSKKSKIKVNLSNEKREPSFDNTN